ncbi:uncharacterized protein LJ206_004643 isoform 2-T2 [Theristicus caerulescens]
MAAGVLKERKATCRRKSCSFKKVNLENSLVSCLFLGGGLPPAESSSSLRSEALWPNYSALQDLGFQNFGSSVKVSSQNTHVSQ